MIHPVLAAVESTDQKGVGVRVEFRKDNDRFSHVVWLVEKGEKTLSLASNEGAETDVAPRSPPCAEWHQQGGMVFLTGATTNGHWSISVEPINNGVLFDVACRIKGNMSQIGSEYEVCESANRSLFDICVEEAIVDDVASDQLRILPATPLTVYPATIRWRYSIVVRAN